MLDELFRMTDSRDDPVSVQVRLLFEEKCRRSFVDLLVELRPQCEFTLIIFDYGVSRYSNVAFKTTLGKEDLIASLENLVVRWKSTTRRKIPVIRADGFPDVKDLGEWAEIAKRVVGEETGFSIIAGSGELTQYVSSGKREDVANLLENDLLPELRGKHEIVEDS